MSLDDLMREAAGSGSVVLLSTTGPRVVPDPRLRKWRTDAEVAEAIAITRSKRGAVLAIGLSDRRVWIGSGRGRRRASESAGRA